MAPEVTFGYDFDSDLYMFSKEPDAKSWTVLVHSRDGEVHAASLDRFSAYPGCDSHEGEAAWLVDFYGAEKIEIRRPAREPVLIPHPFTRL